MLGEIFHVLCLGVVICSNSRQPRSPSNFLHPQPSQSFCSSDSPQRAGIYELNIRWATELCPSSGSRAEDLAPQQMDRASQKVIPELENVFTVLCGPCSAAIFFSPLHAYRYR